MNEVVDQASPNDFSSGHWSVLTNPGLIGATSLTFLLLGLVVWASVAPLASAVMAAGTVVVADNIKTVQSLDGGLIETVDVHDGDTVSEGQKVVSFRSRAQKNLVDVLALSVTENRLAQARLRAEIAGKKFIQTSIETQLVGDDVYVGLLKDQTDLFQTQVRSKDIHLLQIQSEISGLVSALTGIAIEKVQLSKRLSLSVDDTSAAANLAHDGLGTMKAKRDSEAAEAMLVGELASLSTHDTDIQQQIRHLQLEALQTTLTFRETSALELQKLHLDEQDLRVRFVQASTNLAQMIVRSPISGTVINEAVHTIGGVVLPGSTLLEVVPSGQKLIVESQIRPIDIDDVVVGSPVSIREEGRGSGRLSEFEGRVLSVSADRIIDTTRSDPYFLVKIEVDKMPDKWTRDILRPGMALDVIIRKRSQTLLRYLLRPVENAFFHSMRE